MADPRAWTDVNIDWTNPPLNMCTDYDTIAALFYGTLERWHTVTASAGAGTPNTTYDNDGPVRLMPLRERESPLWPFEKWPHLYRTVKAIEDMQSSMFSDWRWCDPDGDYDDVTNTEMRDNIYNQTRGAQKIGLSGWGDVVTLQSSLSGASLESLENLDFRAWVNQRYQLVNIMRWLVVNMTSLGISPAYLKFSDGTRGYKRIGFSLPGFTTWAACEAAFDAAAWTMSNGFYQRTYYNAEYNVPSNKYFKEVYPYRNQLTATGYLPYIFCEYRVRYSPLLVGYTSYVGTSVDFEPIGVFTTPLKWFTFDDQGECSDLGDYTTVNYRVFQDVDLAAGLNTPNPRGKRCDIDHFPILRFDGANGLRFKDW